MQVLDAQLVEVGVLFRKLDGVFVEVDADDGFAPPIALA